MRNLTMLMDYYELTMSNGYFEKGFKDKMVVFDMFYRKNPDNGGFVVSAGLEQLIEYIENMHFSKEDIEFLRSRASSQKDSCSILLILSLQEILMRCRKARSVIQILRLSR